MSISTRPLLSVLEHFRTAILPRQPEGWTEEELETILTDQQQRDKLAVTAQLARLGSVP